MPNIKSAKKRVVQTEKRTQRNTMRRSAIKTAIKRVLTAVENNDLQAAQTLLKDAEAKIARAKGKGLLHENTAARKISRIAKKVTQATRAAQAK